LPDDVKNDGVKPVLGRKLANLPDCAQWLCERIREIEEIAGMMPSTAVLVNGEDIVEPMAKALDAALLDFNIRAVA
jgi:hypothetical protein